MYIGDVSGLRCGRLVLLLMLDCVCFGCGFNSVV